MMNQTLILCLVDNLVALEFARDDEVSPDFAVRLMEAVGAELQLLPEEERQDFVETVLALAKSKGGEFEEFIEQLPDALGLGS